LGLVNRGSGPFFLEVNMATWVKENGTEIELNEKKPTIEQARILGWKKKI